ncbi:MAG: hypothetical protein ACE3JQ_03395 [Paenisporosarcina sp.]
MMVAKSNKTFTTSVNLKFDIGNKEFIRRYLPTPSHAESLKGIIGGFLGENKNNAHIMIGPYGSGKSLAATIVADIFSNKIRSSDFNQLITKFKDVDQEIFEKLKSAQESNISFIPVTLSGNEGPFGKTIINSIIKSLKNADHELNIPGELNEIKIIITNWESHFPRTLNEFKRHIKEKGFTFNQWMKVLNQNSSLEIEWFKKVYPLLTAGAVFQVNYETSFLENITEIINQLNEKNLKIFIAYDEFGRFLQSLEIDQIYKTMQDLQDLAEAATRSNNSIQLLLISHKNMSHYMLGHNEEFKAEFQRIEKRFKTYFVESDKATFYRIAQQYTKNMQEEHFLHNQESNNTKLIMKKYSLFSELNHQEIERLIVEGSYPIHPLALFLLPRLSNTFGQNERTLFTFLESDESGGLNNFVLKKNEGMYYPHVLFDYFFKNSSSEFIKDETFHHLKTYVKLSSALTITKENQGQINLIKLITLWSLSNANNVVKLNKELLMFGTGQSLEILETNLNSLVKQKLLRYNRVLSQWELNEGSSVIIEELIEVEYAKLKTINPNRIDILTSLLNKKFYVATDYNDDKSMTRFMNVKLITSEIFLNMDFDGKLEGDSDGVIYYVMAVNRNEYKDSINKIKTVSDKSKIFAVTSKNYKLIRSSIDRLIVLNSLFQNKQLLSEYKNLDEELKVLMEEVKYEVKKYLNSFESYGKHVKWLYKGKEIEVHNEVMLENFVSSIMYELFPKTPEIRNDSINRNSLNGMQTKAMYSVLNSVVKSPNFERLGIEGQGPDYLIYATVFKNNNFDLTELPNINNEFYMQLRNDLVAYLDKYQEGTLKDVEEVMTSSPYGIRKPLVPLLLVSLLRDKWEQLMFYRNGMYVTAVDAEKIYGMFKESYEYQYVFQDYSPEFSSFIKKVESFMRPHVSEYVSDQTILIKASSGLLNWLRQLPRHSQITNRLSPELLHFKETIRKIEINPLVNLELLRTSYSDLNDLEQKITELENHFGEFKQEVKSRLFTVLQVNKFEDFTEKINSYSAEQIKRNRILKSVNLKDDQFIEEFAYKYTGIEIENWSDTTFELFDRQVQNDYIELNNSVVDDNTILMSFNGDTKSIKIVELSTKSQTIYSNVKRMIENAGRSVPRDEIEYLVYKLMDEYIE